MEFTFCILSYNQRNCIVYQLESIKYLIDNYGNDVCCKFILADDASKDDTVKVVKQWLNQNEKLFDDVDIMVNDENKGTVNNFCRAINAITTENFKILAGDDLYTSNNVFECFDHSDFYISPTIHFTGETVTSCQTDKFYNYLLSFGDNKDEIRRFIERQYKYSTGIEAPGMFFRKEPIDGMLESIFKGFKWIDDTPLVNYIISLPTTNVKILEKPYVMYRIDSGVSHNKTSTLYIEYEKEKEMLDKTVHVRRRNVPHCFNPYQYIRFMDIIHSQFNGIVHNDYIDKLRKNNHLYSLEIEKSKKHLLYIMNRAYDLYKYI